MTEGEDLRDRFRVLGEASEPDLFEGALLIASLVDPADDVEAARREVAALAGRVAARTAAGEAPHEALRAVLFDEEDFRGDEETYDQPGNSSVVRVISRRRGMPITLSIVTIEVGRQAGLRLNGVGLPGHFVVSGPDLPEGMFLDPFDGGALHDAAALSARVSSIFETPVALGRDALRPDPSRAILSRVLANLRRSFARRDRWEDALDALELAEALEPGDASLPRERALLLARAGREDEAEALREAQPSRRVFTLDEAKALLPRVQELTGDAVTRFARLPDEMADEREAILQDWAREIESLGAEIKGVWLVDFDSGAGYYCWKYPEAALDHFHGYEEGFAGRLRLT